METIGDRFALDDQLDARRLFTRYRAVDLREPRDGYRNYVSLWLFEPEVGADESVAARLRHDFARISNLSHASIAGVDALYDVDGRFFATGEHVDGEPLRSVLDSLSPERLDAAEADEIVCAVGDALVHAHACGVVHGDVRAENVLVTTQTEFKLTNFMPACVHGPAHAPSRADDVRDLAALAYELYTGVPLSSDSTALSAAGLSAPRRRALEAVLGSTGGAGVTAMSFLTTAGLAAGPAGSRGPTTARAGAGAAEPLHGSVPRAAPYFAPERAPARGRWALIVPGVAIVAAVAGVYWSDSILGLVADRGSVAPWMEEWLPAAGGSTAAGPAGAIADARPDSGASAGGALNLEATTADGPDSARSGASAGEDGPAPRGASDSGDTALRPLPDSGVAAVSATGERAPLAASTGRAGEDARVGDARIGDTRPGDARSEDAPPAEDTGTVSGAPDARDTAESEPAPPEPPAAAAREPAVVTLARSDVTTREGQGVVIVDVVSEGEADGAIEFVWWTSAGTARAGEDYADLGRRVETLRPDGSVRLYIPIVSDAIREDPEHFFVHLGPDPEGATLGAVSQARVTLIDDDR